MAEVRETSFRKIEEGRFVCEKTKASGENRPVRGRKQKGAAPNPVRARRDRSPWIGQYDLLARPGSRRALALLHGHKVADIGQHRLQVRHFAARVCVSAPPGSLLSGRHVDGGQHYGRRTQQQHPSRTTTFGSRATSHLPPLYHIT